MTSSLRLVFRRRVPKDAFRTHTLLWATLDGVDTHERQRALCVLERPGDSEPRLMSPAVQSIRHSASLPLVAAAMFVALDRLSETCTSNVGVMI